MRAAGWRRCGARANRGLGPAGRPPDRHRPRNDVRFLAKLFLIEIVPARIGAADLQAADLFQFPIIRKAPGNVQFRGYIPIVDPPKDLRSLSRQMRRASAHRKFEDLFRREGVMSGIQPPRTEPHILIGLAGIDAGPLQENVRRSDEQNRPYSS